MKKINLKNVGTSTWVRSAVLLIALINQALVVFGVTDKSIDIDAAINYISYFLTAACAVWSWWKNNSFTAKAQRADEFILSETNSKG